MKAGLILTLAFAVVGGSAFAQTFHSSKRVAPEEVPVTIVQTLEKDFGVYDRGYWRLYFTVNISNSAFAVENYVFIGKKEGKKIKIAYNADGTVARAKGVTVPETLASKK